MIKTILILISLAFWTSCMTSQLPSASAETIKETMSEKLPFHQIPDAPETYTAESVAARMVDGLGYRYYWATQGLTEKEMDYKPGEDSRTVRETLEHLTGLSQGIANAMLQKPNVRTSEKVKLSLDERRAITLQNLQTASDILHKAGSESLKSFNVVFQRGEKSSSFPFWNLINGQISDALWHTGQIVMMRRAAGNPIPPGVNVFMGKTSE
ncbi:MAG: putative damage-inducible protein DinB [Saprospiraceae bacterium]|jgi:uncharacterized damage-inducible protein DinB